MKDKVIKTDSVSEYASVIALLFTYGYRHFDDKSFDTLTKEWGTGMMKEFSWVCVDLREDTFCGYRKDAADYARKDILSFTEGLAFLTNPKPKTAKINIGEYKNCVYNKDQIEVGCQTITFETIEKLYNGMKALKN